MHVSGSQRHNISIVWHINSHERHAHVMNIQPQSSYFTLIWLRNTHLFKVRSRIIWDPKAWSWNEAWARWTSCWRMKNRVRPDAGVSRPHCLQIESRSEMRPFLWGFYQQSHHCEAISAWLHYHSNNHKHVFLSGLVKCDSLSQGGLHSAKCYIKWSRFEHTFCFTSIKLINKRKESNDKVPPSFF